jgi:hypothetical protein
LLILVVSGQQSPAQPADCILNATHLPTRPHFRVTLHVKPLQKRHITFLQSPNALLATPTAPASLKRLRWFDGFALGQTI